MGWRCWDLGGAPGPGPTLRGRFGGRDRLRQSPALAAATVSGRAGTIRTSTESRRIWRASVENEPGGADWTFDEPSRGTISYTVYRTDRCWNSESIASKRVFLAIRSSSRQVHFAPGPRGVAGGSEPLHGPGQRWRLVLQMEGLWRLSFQAPGSRCQLVLTACAVMHDFFGKRLPNQGQPHRCTVARAYMQRLFRAKKHLYSNQT